MCNRKDVVKPEQMVDMMWFEPAATEDAPSAYVIPATPAMTKAVELLKSHGIKVQASNGSALRSPIERFAITANTAGQTFEGHAIRRLEGTWSEAMLDVAPNSKWYEVPMNQPLARLAFYLLEPASDDGLVAWNYLDDSLKDATSYPILRRK
jgi:hypothetical protein